MLPPRPYIAPDEAAPLAVFDPYSKVSRDSLSKLLTASPSPSTLAIAPKFTSIVDQCEKHFQPKNPWSADPVACADTLVLRLRKYHDGNIAPKVRETAESQNLAVFDFITERVFAPESEQHRFETGEWLVDVDPNALYAGCFVEHATFGKGRIQDIGVYKGMDVFVIKFKDRGRVISVELGFPFLRRVAAGRQTTWERIKGWRI